MEDTGYDLAKCFLFLHKAAFAIAVSKSCLKILLKMQIAKFTGTSELVVYYTPCNIFFFTCHCPIHK